MPGSLPTRDAAIMCNVALSLFGDLSIPLDDVRGIGIVISKLDTNEENDTHPKAGNCRSGSVSTWLHKAAQAAMEEKQVIHEEGPAEACAPPGGPDIVATQDFENPSNIDMSSQIAEPNQKCEVAEVSITQPQDVMLPPLSQICMSQVAALPTELRNAIYSKMTALQNQNCEIIDVDNLDDCHFEHQGRVPINRMARIHW